MPRPADIGPRGRAVHVTPYYPPHLGGLEVVAEALATGLSDQYDIEVVTSAIPVSATASPDAVPRVTRLRTFEAAHTPFMPGLPGTLLRTPAADLYHVHLGVAYTPEVVGVVAHLRHRPVIAHFHLDVDPSGPWGRFYGVYKRHLLTRVMRSAARVVVVSPDQVDVVRHVYGVPDERIVLIPNGVSDRFAVVDRAVPADRADALTLLFVGRLAPQKNVPLLIEAVARMTVPVVVRVVGDGEDRGYLERRIGELGLTNVTLVGARHGEDLIAEYRGADAFVLTSVKESTGLVILEAFAARLPVVATDVEGVRTTVGRDGLLVEPTPDALATALDRVAGDAGLRAELAERSARRASAHPWSAAVDQVAELYEQVLAERAPVGDRW